MAYKFKLNMYSFYHISTSSITIPLSLNVHWKNCKGLDYVVSNVPICLVISISYKKPKQRWMAKSNKNIFTNFSIFDAENKYENHMKVLFSYNSQYFLFSKRLQVLFKHY